MLSVAERSPKRVNAPSTGCNRCSDAGNGAASVGGGGRAVQFHPDVFERKVDITKIMNQGLLVHAQRIEQDCSRTMLALGVPTVQAHACLHMVFGRYTEGQRHYHTLEHLSAMLAALDAHEAHHSVNRNVIVLAILFHDIVYDTRRQDNEDASIALFAKWARNAIISPNLQDAVVLLIDRTKNHDSSGPSHRDLALFLDLDLEVLSRSPADYRRYRQQVRQEYAHVPTPLFAFLRAKVLRQLLTQPSLYKTEPFLKDHEQAARKNLTNEIAELDEQTRGLVAQATIKTWQLTQKFFK